MDKNNNFIYGTQYYRKPTPDSTEWEKDLANMKKMGLKDVKFWVQWRGNHIEEDKFDFSDIDRLMDIAWKNDLRVTLNIIADGAPVWLLKKYPDSVQVTADGQRVVQYAPGHRQLGGFPGVCYNNPVGIKYRKKFFEEVAKRYSNHPAMYMWDVWNEPEQCGPYRTPKLEKLTCFCEHCKADFIEWLKNKYKTVENLNRVWGKIYSDFDDVELPVAGQTLKDFCDWRMYHAEVMTREAKMRIEAVKASDSEHKVYLHVVPNTSAVFNALTGVDDFEMARQCDVFASTNFAPPIWSLLTTSAGEGKLCYNVECHIGSGTVAVHPKQVTFENLVNDFAPQLGCGIRGFMFWQYRPETLGIEAPAWGMTKLDGEPGKIANAAKLFMEKIKPYEDKLQKPKQKKAQVAIWKGFENEIFQFAMHGSLMTFAASVNNYAEAVYNNNYDCKFVDDVAVTALGEEVKLLIMPKPYSMNKKIAEAVDEFVKRGGVLLTEAHFGGYDMDKGRHSIVVPGCGMAERWGIKEIETTSSIHLNLSEKENIENFASEDAKKAIEIYGTEGGIHFPVEVKDCGYVTGENRVAFLEGEDMTVTATIQNMPIIAVKKIEKGKIVYVGTNLGECAGLNRDNFEKFVVNIIKMAGVTPNLGMECKHIHIDCIEDNFISVKNMSDSDFKPDGNYKSIFYDGRNTVLAGQADIMVKN